MKFLLNPLVPGAQSGLVDGYIGPKSRSLKGEMRILARILLFPKAPYQDGQYAPVAAHALIRFPNSA
jgi:hypothetical protein